MSLTKPNHGVCKNKYFSSPFEINVISPALNEKKNYLRSSENPINSQKEEANLFINLRFPLTIGILFGIIPIQGLLSRNHSFKWLHYRTFICATVTIALLLHTIFIGHRFFFMLFKGSTSAGDLIMILSGVWFYLIGTFICAFFLCKSKQICCYFDEWNQVSKEISRCSKPDLKINQHVALISGAIFINCVGENVLYHFHAMGDEQRRSLNITRFMIDYYESNQYIRPFFNYTPAITVAVLVTNKIATFAGNFGDLFLILVTRGLLGKFRSLNKYVESMLEESGSISWIRKGSIDWKTIRKNFLSINNLRTRANNLIAPLIWISFATNIFFICRQMFEALAPRLDQATFINKVYMIWSLVLLIGRFLGVNLMASVMNEEAHRIFRITQHCHPEDYDDEIYRLEQYVTSRPLGITGNGCFVITRSFLMKVLSVMFTLEVVLVQNAHLTFG